MTAPLAIALAVPIVVELVRVRRLLAAGHQRDDLVGALAARQARRREELAFVYGSGPTSFERSMGRLGGAALLAAAVARARTEQRTDPIGERTLRFWRSSIGRALFRVAGIKRSVSLPIVTVLDRLETPA